MTIFVDGEFAGDGDLPTTGPGGTLELPLGADEDVRLTREVATRTEQKGLVSKEEVTEYAVHIEVGNYKRRRITLDVYEVLPKTNNEEIEVRLERVTPKLAEGPDARGRLRWRLTLPPGQTRSLDFVYTIRRPKDWQLIQR
jgi:uncharacterized protein (TIGR02231 family)